MVRVLRVYNQLINYSRVLLSLWSLTPLAQKLLSEVSSMVGFAKKRKFLKIRQNGPTITYEWGYNPYMALQIGNWGPLYISGVIILFIPRASHLFWGSVKALQFFGGSTEISTIPINEHLVYVPTKIAYFRCLVNTPRIEWLGYETFGRDTKHCG